MLAPAKTARSSAEGRTVVYSPRTSEFDKLKTDLGGGEGEQIAAGDRPGVLIVTRGARASCMPTVEISS